MFGVKVRRMNTLDNMLTFYYKLLLTKSYRQIKAKWRNYSKSIKKFFTYHSLPKSAIVSSSVDYSIYFYVVV